MASQNNALINNFPRLPLGFRQPFFTVLVDNIFHSVFKGFKILIKVLNLKDGLSPDNRGTELLLSGQNRSVEKTLYIFFKSSIVSSI